MLLAWGDAQTNQLQVHRPEVCYPAFGYEILDSKASALTLASGAVLPVRELVVRRAEHIEQIVYWTRLGDFLPTSVRDQRIDRMRNALAGIVSDGLLARFSQQVVTPNQTAAGLERFAADLIGRLPIHARRVLLGSRLGAAGVQPR